MKNGKVFRNIQFFIWEDEKLMLGYLTIDVMGFIPKFDKSTIPLDHATTTVDTSSHKILVEDNVHESLEEVNVNDNLHSTNLGTTEKRIHLNVEHTENFVPKLVSARPVYDLELLELFKKRIALEVSMGYYERIPREQVKNSLWNVNHTQFI
uniref:Uncharacterized protein n=1 Tax=Strongyloides stercoralis TaxID=6248 RepID=A0A0K0EMM3_STRER